MIKAIKKYFKEMGMSPEEKYLNAATDLADLENRMRQLKYKGFWV